MLTYPAKLVAERRFATMDFTAQLAQLGSGITIASCVVSIAVTEGDDSNPSAVLDGGSVINGNVVGQWIKGGVAGAFYILTWLATCSDGSVLERQRLLVVNAQW